MSELADKIKERKNRMIDPDRILCIYRKIQTSGWSVIDMDSECTCPNVKARGDCTYIIKNILVCFDCKYRVSKE